MSLTDTLADYDTRALLTVAGLLLAALLLRLVVLPLVVATVLLDRTQHHLTGLAAAMPTSPPAPTVPFGGDRS